MVVGLVEEDLGRGSKLRGAPFFLFFGGGRQGSFTSVPVSEVERGCIGYHSGVGGMGGFVFELVSSDRELG